MKAIGGLKRCSHCKVVKSVVDDSGNVSYANFGVKTKAIDGFQDQCKVCKKGTYKPVEDSKRKRAPAGKGKRYPRAIAKSKVSKSDTTSAPVAPAPVVNEQAPVVVNNAPAPVQCKSAFVDIDGRLFNIDDISIVDPVGDSIEIVMRSTEMSNQGYIHSRVYRYSGAQKDLVMASIAVASGHEPKRLLNEIAALEVAYNSLLAGQERLKDGIKAAEAERDAAMALASELEAKYNQIKSMFN